MKLLEKQQLFARMVANLIQYATMLGYGVTFGDAYRDPRCPYGHPNSLHRRRLAVDLNLFKNGEYLTSTYDYEPLGLFWEQIGGTWGGSFSDGNHFSLEHEGMK